MLQRTQKMQEERRGDGGSNAVEGERSNRKVTATGRIESGSSAGIVNH
jgi:hypothetical protein